MKRFIIDLVRFGLVVLTAITIAKVITPFHWGNPDLARKIEYFKTQEDHFDSFFIGSSGIYRQLMPEIVDSLTSGRSFNLGSDAMFFLETHYILDHILQNSEKEKWKVYLSEVQVHYMNEHNLHTVRNKYFMDWKRLKIALTALWEKKNYQQLKWHIKAFIENALAIGELKGILFYWLKRSLPVEPILVDQQGFWAMDQEYGDQNSLGSKSPNDIKMTDEELNEYRFRIRTIDSLMINQYNLPHSSNYHLIPWSMPLGNAYMYDSGHFNLNGARIYSHKIGEAIADFND